MLGRPGELSAGLEEGDGRVVVDRLGVQRPMTHRSSATLAVWGNSSLNQVPLAMLGEFERSAGRPGSSPGRGHAGEPLAHADRVGQLLARRSCELRLGVEQVHLRRRARLEQVDHRFALGAKCGRPGKPPAAGCSDARPVHERAASAAAPRPARPGRRNGGGSAGGVEPGVHVRPRRAGFGVVPDTLSLS